MMLRSVLIVAVIAVASRAAAQEAGPPAPAGSPVERLTLDAAIARGVENSQRLAELQARKEGADAAEEGRRAAARPPARTSPRRDRICVSRSHARSGPS